MSLVYAPITETNTLVLDRKYNCPDDSHPAPIARILFIARRTWGKCLTLFGILSVLIDCSRRRFGSFYAGNFGVTPIGCTAASA